MNDIQFRKFCKIQDMVGKPRTYSEMVFQDVRGIIVCDDGFTFSCQASEGHYSSPKKTGLPAKDYKAWEIGYPSVPDHAILPFIEDDERDATDSVYPYVPTDIVIHLIESHGGLKCP